MAGPEERPVKLERRDPGERIEVAENVGRRTLEVEDPLPGGYSIFAR